MQSNAESQQEIYRRCLARLEATLATLPDKSEETAPATLAALWHAAAGAPWSAAAAESHPLAPLDAAGAESLHRLTSRRLAGEPLAYVVGRQQFMGLELIAGPAALIPRRETEILGRAALALAERMARERGEVRVLDICTGSGNLAIALACREPRARVWGADLSAEAIDLAERNARFQGGSDRIDFRAGDLLQPFDTPEFRGNVDLIVCNPPYISSGKVDTLPDEIARHEPRLAFDGGPLGIRILNRLIHEAPHFLRPGGFLVFEVGMGQARGVRRRIEQGRAYAQIIDAVDGSGNVRAIAAQAGG